MLDAVRPDFLVNVSPPGAHHAVTTAALERGVHVLSEKPMAATLAQAVDMIAVADRTERLLMVSQNRRYYPGLIAFRDTVARLGPLSNLTCQFFIAHRDGAAEFLFGFPEPLLLDMAIHLFDGARAITGRRSGQRLLRVLEPALELVRRGRRGGRDLHDDRRAPLHVHRQLGRGRVPHLVDGHLARDRRARQRDLGGRGRAAGLAGARRARRGRRAGRAGPRPGALPGLEFSLAEFVDALRTGRVPAGECHDNLRSLAMCHAAVESARTGRRVAVEA